MQNEFNIRPLLNDLLNINEKTPQDEISKLKKFSLVWVNNRDEVRRALRNRIKKWNDILDEYYEKSRKSDALLKHLKEIAKTLLTGQKTNIMRVLLQKEGYEFDESLEKNLKRTEELLSRILNANESRPFLNLAPLSFELKSPIFPHMTSISRELVASLPSTEPIHISFPDIVRPKSPIDVAKELLMSRIEGMSPEKDDAWLRKLVPTLEAISDENQFNLVIAKMTFHQIFVLLLDYARANKGIMVLKLLKSSKDDMVLECLRTFSGEEIESVNQAINGVKDFELIQRTFAYIREIFVTKANSFTPDIDRVAKMLREIPNIGKKETPTKDKITEFHIQSIESFKKPIQELMATNVNFHKLIEKRVTMLDSATAHMPEKIRLTCEDRLSRVTNDADSRKKRDNLYAILVELSYGDVDEEDDITGCLGMLGLNEVEEFIKLGLNVESLPTKAANDPNASNLLQNENTKRFCQIYGQFEKLGIKTVGDLINKNIYNYAQLKKLVENGNKLVPLPSAALKS